MKHDAAVAVNRLVDIGPGTQGRDDHRDLVFDAERQILIEPLVGFMDDEVNGKRRVVVSQLAPQVDEPSSSTPDGRALSDGKVPMTPARHAAMTSCGWEIVNRGAAMAGIDRR